MKRLILHVGPHKTASSYIQKELSDHEQDLSRHKILYPKKWREFLWGHHSLVTDVINASKSRSGELEKIQQYFIDEYREYNTIIVSSENIEYWSQKEIEIFNALNDIAKIEIIYYIRKISGLSYSSWQENIKHGSIETFFEFIFRHYSTPFLSDLFNYENVLSKFNLSLPKSDIKVIVYDNLIGGDIDIAEHFFKEVLKLSWFKRKVHEADRKINARLNPINVEIIRALNLYYSLKKVEVNDKIRNKFLKNVKEYANEMEILTHESKKFVREVVIDDSSFVPMSLYSNIYKKYYNNILNASDNNLFDTMDNEKINVISSDMWFCEKNMQQLNKIIQVLDQLK